MNKKVLDFVAIGGAFGGSTILASNLGINYLGYILFLMGCSATYFLLKGNKELKSLAYINYYFIFINIVGLVRYSM